MSQEIYDHQYVNDPITHLSDSEDEDQDQIWTIVEDTGSQKFPTYEILPLYMVKRQSQSVKTDEHFENNNYETSLKPVHSRSEKAYLFSESKDSENADESWGFYESPLPSDSMKDKQSNHHHRLSRRGDETEHGGTTSSDSNYSPPLSHSSSIHDFPTMARPIGSSLPSGVSRSESTESLTPIPFTRSDSYANAYQLSRIFSSFNLNSLPDIPSSGIMSAQNKINITPIGVVTSSDKPQMILSTREMIMDYQTDGSTTMTISLQSFYERENRNKLIYFLRHHVHCLQSHVEDYVDRLLSHHIYSLELLYLILLNDESYLVKELGFDVEDSLDIIEAITTLLAASQNKKKSLLLSPSSSSTSIMMMNKNSYYGNKSGSIMKTESRDRLLIKSTSSATVNTINTSHSAPPSPLRVSKPNGHYSSSTSTSSLKQQHYLTEVQYRKLFSPYHYTVEEIVHLYYEASQCWRTKARMELFHTASINFNEINNEQKNNNNKNHFFAEGFIMRMFALGQGGLEPSHNIATQIAQRLLPLLRQIVSDYHLQDEKKDEKLNPEKKDREQREETAEVNDEDKESRYCSALFLLGVCYSEGIGGVEKDDVIAFDYYRQSAERGFSIAQAVIAYCFYTATGTKRSIQRAIEWWRLAAAQGHASAQTNLGLCHEHGQGVSKSMEEAVKWYSLASKQGDVSAHYNLAYALERGYARKYLSQSISSDKSVQPTERSTEGENMEERGEEREGGEKEVNESRRKDNENAMHYCKKAVKLYEKCVRALYYPAFISLGYYYERGVIVTKNPKKAFQFYLTCATQASRTSYLSTIALAEYKLGECSMSGIGVTVDVNEAVRWFEKSLEDGNVMAAFALGRYYGGEDGDLKKSIEYYQLAAKKGYAPAQVIIASYYENGLHSFPQYPMIAFQYYKQAAEQGYAEGEYHLARCYERGIGIEKKMSEMMKYYKKAANQDLLLQKKH
eukprot:CAMPEP_0173155992 /NCGR_PEP_ID=MMETSP1105-20130129/14477_1 /TAXON_ID=2985 /ORGANISM="Ochromonas sp., Strain BG-1" /LENGTH=961 /DNA_ID=CAMNT_0014072607 /DNA_START=128 /DNA_END=3014 /DNA_ORIENTATION=-